MILGNLGKYQNTRNSLATFYVDVGVYASYVLRCSSSLYYQPILESALYLALALDIRFSCLCRLASRSQIFFFDHTCRSFPFGSLLLSSILFSSL